MENSAIVAKGLGIRRGGRWLLRPVSFGFAGGVIGVAGPSGSGKSVLLATLATLHRPNTGTLEILGRPTATRGDLRRLRSRIGFLPADAPRPSGCTVRDYVAYAAYYQRRPPASVQEALDALDLAETAAWPLDALPADLRVRAGLAAACVHRPDLAFLDEPLRGLPDRTVAELAPLLAGLAPTVVITAEHPARLSWCDRVHVLQHGRLTQGVLPRAAAEPPHVFEAAPVHRPRLRIPAYV